MTNNKKKINYAGITWLVLLVAAILAFIMIIRFILFPAQFTWLVAVVLLVIAGIMGFFSLRHVKGKDNKKIAVTVINSLLSVVLIVVSVYLPILNGKLSGLFVEPTNTQEVRINAYVMSETYKSEHAGNFSTTVTSTDLADYKDARFITQKQMDQENQTYALEDIQKKLEVNSLNIVSQDDIWSALSALYGGTGDVLVLSEFYESTITEVQGYENFTTDTQILYTVTKTIEVETAEPTPDANVSDSFMVFIAGSDTRGTNLTMYTRTDVDMIMTVDPKNKQVLLVSIPRDWYVKNPALGNGYDKLTHLGNSGLMNAVEGLNQEFGFDYMTDYFSVNFVTFKNIVDGIGGVDINNPYAFTTNNGSCKIENGQLVATSPYTFQAGNIHLDGNEALAYVRERYNLPNGDYGRNEHQAIVLQGILNKLTSASVVASLPNLLNNLQGNFLTSISSDFLFELASAQITNAGSWNFVSYHLTGVGDHNSTASMGAQQLYVSYPIAAQVEFAKEQMTKVMNGEIITQETLPDEDKTIYLPN